MGKQKCWSHAHFSDKGSDKVCKACGEELGNTSGTRLKQHLAVCKKASDAIKDRAKQGLENTPTARKRKGEGTGETDGKSRGKIARQLGAIRAVTAMVNRFPAERDNWLTSSNRHASCTKPRRAQSLPSSPFCSELSRRAAT
eukprot:Hpha_TRINITY_DN15628_c6_g3::TRINITY_DN15628_c6_g3_i1::g.98082::m.98082